MSWFRKKQNLHETIGYDPNNAESCMCMLRQFLADVALLERHLDSHPDRGPEFEAALKWAHDGARMAACDYTRALESQGLMRRLFPPEAMEPE